MKRIIYATLSILMLHLSAYGQAFDTYFTDATLRIDYIFSGDAGHQEISVDQLSRMPRWWGKRHHLSEVPVAGNGQAVVRDHHSHDA